MPKITAPTVAEHAAQQEAAIFDAAIRLFLERGYEHVSMGDIATEVGLARNSLYRYFPDKAHMLAQWVKAQMPRQRAEAEQVLAEHGTTRERLHAWVINQMDYALRPEHGLLSAIGVVAHQLDEQTRDELAAFHRDMGEPVDQLLRDAGIDEPTERRIVAGLIAGFVLAASSREATGGPDPRVRARVLQGVDGLVGI